MNKAILNHYNESLRVYRLLINFLPEIEEISKLLLKIIKKKKYFCVWKWWLIL